MAENLRTTRERYQLTQLKDQQFDPSIVLFNLCNELNSAGLNNLLEWQNYNRFSAGVRILEENLRYSLDDDDRIALESMREDIRDAEELGDKVEYQMQKLGLLYLVIHGKVKTISYATYEGDRPGAVSQWMSARCMEKDRNVIHGIFGGTGSGKSETAIRLATNISRQTQRTLEIADVVYNYESLLKRLKERKEAGTLAGSVQIVDEGGASFIDSQSWFEEDVKDVVNLLRTNRYQNTTTIIVSPLYTDLAKRARGLFHSTMIPWREFGQRYLELTDTANIDYERNLSYWKIDLAEIDPMTGEAFKGKLKAALGNIRKVDILKPPRAFTTKYKHKSRKFKDGIQATQLKRRERTQAQRTPDKFINEKAVEILENPERFKSKDKRVKVFDWTEIKDYFQVGEPTAKQIRNRAIRLKEEKDERKNQKPAI